MCPLVSYTKPEPNAVAFWSSSGLVVEGGFGCGISRADDEGGGNEGILEVIWTMEFWTLLDTKLRKWLCKSNMVVPLIVLDVVVAMLVRVVLWNKVLEGRVCFFDDCVCGGSDGGNCGDCDTDTTVWCNGYPNRKTPANTIETNINNGIFVGNNAMVMF
jgi:hypothetical protein